MPQQIPSSTGDPGDTRPHIRTFAKDAQRLGQPFGKKSPPPVPAPAKERVDTLASLPKLQGIPVTPNAPTTSETKSSVVGRFETVEGVTIEMPPIPAELEKQNEPQKPLTAEGRPTPPEQIKEVEPKPVIEEKPAQPVTPPSREEIFSRLKKIDSSVEVPPENLPPQTIHTYSTDVRDASKRAQATPFTILAREQDAGGGAPETLHRKHNPTVAIAGGFLLIIFGIVSVTLAYNFVKNESSIMSELSVPSLISPDSRARISGEGKKLQSVLASLTDSPLQNGDVLVAYVTHASTTPKGPIEEPASGGALIAAMDIKAPDIVLRNINPESTVGVVKAGDETGPFFILSVSSFERTFAGMLSWEKTLQSDLAILYPLHTQTATSTSTSTPTVTTYVRAKSAFEDAVVENRNVRILKDELGKTLLVYGYRNKDLLIIARNEAAFSEILNRLANTKR